MKDFIPYAQPKEVGFFGARDLEDGSVEFLDLAGNITRYNDGQRIE